MKGVNYKVLKFPTQSHNRFITFGREKEI